MPRDESVAGAALVVGGAFSVIVREDHSAANHADKVRDLRLNEVQKLFGSGSKFE
jgi:hypothetical protein